MTLSQNHSSTLGQLYCQENANVGPKSDCFLSLLIANWLGDLKFYKCVLDKKKNPVFNILTSNIKALKTQNV